MFDMLTVLMISSEFSIVELIKVLNRLISTSPSLYQLSLGNGVPMALHDIDMDELF